MRLILLSGMSLETEVIMIVVVGIAITIIAFLYYRKMKRVVQKRIDEQKNGLRNKTFAEFNLLPPTTIHSVTIECPFCKKQVYPAINKKISSGGIILIVAGILLAPILIGIVLIIVGINTKEITRYCPNCKLRLGY